MHLVVDKYMRIAGKIAPNVYWRFAFVFVIVSWLPIYGTSALVIRTPEHVVLAADSLGLQGEMRGQTCKIKHVGGIYSVAAGLARDDKTKFDIYRIIRKASVGKNTAEEAASAFVRPAREGLRIALEQLRRDAPSFYYNPTSGLKQAAEPLQVIFASVWHHDTSFVLVYFTIDNDERVILVTPHIVKCPGDECLGGRRGVELIGENAVARTINPLPNESDVQFAQRLIESEIKASPITVGPPVDILLMPSLAGPTWMRNDKKCP